MKQKKVHKLDKSVVIEGQLIRQPMCAAWAGDLQALFEDWGKEAGGQIRMTFAIAFAFLAPGILMLGIAHYLKRRINKRERLLNEKLERHFKDD